MRRREGAMTSEELDAGIQRSIRDFSISLRVLVNEASRHAEGPGATDSLRNSLRCARRIMSCIEAEVGV
jgi:hypothetical protein